MKEALVLMNVLMLETESSEKFFEKGVNGKNEKIQKNVLE